MSRTTKQIVYGCVYGLIFFLLLRGAYVAIFTSYPTCFDNLQNQGEEKIDCGGPCAACEEPIYEPLAVVDPVLVFTTIPGRVVVLAKIANTNREFIARNFGYTFSVSTPAGRKVAEIGGAGFLPESSEKYLFGSAEIPPEIVKGAEAFLRLDEPEWGMLGGGSEPALSIPTDVTTVTDGTAIRVEGTIKNTAFADADEVEVIALLRDRSDFHDPLYAGKTIIRVRGMAENRFSILFPPSKELAERVDPGLTEVFTSIQ